MNFLLRIYNGITRRDWRLLSLRAFARTVIPDYRLSYYQIDWWHDPRFNEFLDRFGQRTSFNSHRHWTVWQLLRLTSSVEGDTAECGVYQGATSWLMCAGNGGRSHHMFDSFEGLSDPGQKDGKYWRPGDLAAGEELVRRNMVPYEAQCVFHKGWIPDAFPAVADRKFAFVHVDVDLFLPTRDSVEFFYPRLSPGGVLLCDDYGMTTCPGATEAVDLYLADKPEQMVRLDAGGGFIIKGLATPEAKLAGASTAV